MDEEVNSLVRKAKKDQRSFNKLRAQFMPLMQDIIKQYIRFGDRQDLESAADEGFMYAVNKYIGTEKKLGKRPKSFAAYLYQVTTTYVKRGMLKGRLFSLPEIPYDIYARLSIEDRERLKTQLYTEELAAKYDTTVKVMENVRKLALALYVYDSDEIIEKPLDNNFEHLVDNKIKHKAVNDLLTLLPNPYKEVIRLRFGVGGKPPLNWTEIADELGLTRKLVKQHYDDGMRFLKIKENKDFLRKFL